VSGLRIAVRLAGLIGLTLAYVPLHYAWMLAGQRSPWPSRFLGAAARACGVRLSVIGEPLRRDVLSVCNHQSWLDILILGGATGSAFVAKSELAVAPVVGWMASLNRTIFIRREDRRAIGAQIEAVRQGLAEGPVTIFAEGTTNDGTMLLPFKPALLQVLDPAPPGVRVQPLFLDYGAAARAIAWGNEDGAINARRVLGRRGALPVTLHCLAPFSPATIGDRKAIAAEVRRRIGAAIAASGSGMRVPGNGSPATPSS
jgi:1-acyl-sn-glycerol-3-phosphate acyltransferase